MNNVIPLHKPNPVRQASKLLNQALNNINHQTNSDTFWLVADARNLLLEILRKENADGENNVHPA